MPVSNWPYTSFQRRFDKGKKTYNQPITTERAGKTLMGSLNKATLLDKQTHQIGLSNFFKDETIKRNKKLKKV